MDALGPPLEAGGRTDDIRPRLEGHAACGLAVLVSPTGEVLAALRNAAVGLLHRHRMPNLAAGLRANAWSGPAAVLGPLGL